MRFTRMSGYRSELKNAPYQILNSTLVRCSYESASDCKPNFGSG